MSERLHTQVFDAVKVAPVVRQQRDVILQCGGCTQQIYLADEHALGTEAPAFPAKYFCSLFVDADDAHAFQEVIELLLALGGSRE